MEQQQKKIRKSTKAKKSLKEQDFLDQQRSNKLRPEDFQLIKKGTLTGQQDDVTDCVARFKIIIVGDSAVGKSSIMLKATKDLFKQEHQLTIGVDFGGLMGKIGDDFVKLQVWDTAGTQQFRSVTRIFYRDASCVIFVFAINRRQSFESIERWMNQVQTNTDPGTVFVLVGNKSDLDERQVELEQVIQYAKKRGIEIVLQTSAALGTNIDNLFSSIGFTLYQRYLISQQQLMRNNSTISSSKRSSKSSSKLSSSKGGENPKKKKGCC